MTVYQLLVTAHIVAGSIALITFWTAAFARKGRLLHKGVGKVYLIAMLGILATAAPMSGFFFAQGRVGFGVFLDYLVVVTATTVWLARRAIQLKREKTSYFDTRFRSVGILNIVAGLCVFAIGLKLGSALLSGFCWVGVFIGVGMFRRQRTPPAVGNWWLKEHYGAMIGNGVATHVAFLSIGLNGFLKSFGTPWLMLTPWVAPLIASLLAAVYLNRRYGGRSVVRQAVVTGLR